MSWLPLRSSRGADAEVTMPLPLAPSPALASAKPLSRSEGSTLPPAPPLRPPKGPKLSPREIVALGGRCAMVCARLMAAAGLVRGRVRVRLGIG